MKQYVFTISERRHEQKKITAEMGAIYGDQKAKRMLNAMAERKLELSRLERASRFEV
jgi:hypothetical protein